MLSILWPRKLPHWTIFGGFFHARFWLLFRRRRLDLGSRLSFSQNFCWDFFGDFFRRVNRNDDRRLCHRRSCGPRTFRFEVGS
jgi:hypothetical protein